MPLSRSKKSKLPHAVKVADVPTAALTFFHKCLDNTCAAVIGLVQFFQGDVGWSPWVFASTPGQAPGNLRVDYVLPSSNLRVQDSQVFWPAPGQPGAELTGSYPFPTSDNRPVWADLRVR